MDLSNLTEAELNQIAKGDMRMLPEKTLRMLSGQDEYTAEAETRTPLGQIKAGLASAPINLYLGGKQLLTGSLTPVEQEVLKQNRAAERAAPVSSIVGGIGTYAPAMMIPGANTVIGAGAIGAGTGAIQPTMEDESRLRNAALGGALGAGGQYVGQKIGGALIGRRGMQPPPVGQAAAESTVSGGATASGKGGGFTFGTAEDYATQGLNKAQQEALAKGADLGMKFTPGQASGSKTLQQLEAKLESQPMTSGRFFDIKDTNQRVLNRLAAQSIGEKSNTVDSTVLEAAKDRIGNVYKIVADKRSRTINPDDFLNRVSAIETEFEGLLPAQQASIADNVLVKQAFRLAEKGEATGEQLQALASKLGKAATNQMTSQGGDRQVGMALSSVKDVIDDYLEQGLSGETQKLFSDARGQYRNLMLLTGRQGVINPSSGNVNPRALAGALAAKDKSGFVFGKNQGDLYNAVRASQAFPSIVGDSGTATRQVLPGPMDYLLSLPFNVATKAYTSAPAVNVAARVGAAGGRGMAPGAANAQMLGRSLPQYLPPLGALAGAGSASPISGLLSPELPSE